MTISEKLRELRKDIYLNGAKTIAFEEIIAETQQLEAELKKLKDVPSANCTKS